MDIQGIEIKIGQVWRTVGGQEVTIEGNPNDTGNWPWLAVLKEGGRNVMNTTGKFYGGRHPTERDLCALISDPTVAMQPEVAAGQVWHYLHGNQTLQYIIESVGPDGARTTEGALLSVGPLRRAGTCVRPAPTLSAVQEHAAQNGGVVRNTADLTAAIDNVSPEPVPFPGVKVGQVWRNHASTTEHRVVRIESGKALLERTDGARKWVANKKLIVHWSIALGDTTASHRPTPEQFLERDLGDTDFIARSQAAFVASVEPAGLMNGGEAAAIYGAQPAFVASVDDLKFDIKDVAFGQQVLPAEDIDILDIFGEAANDEGHPYHLLVHVMLAAFAQAALGKGKERHASGGTPFHEQPMATINRQLGSVDGFIYQAHKKSLEAKRLPDGRAQAELLGSINYLAGAVIALDTWAKKDAA